MYNPGQPTAAEIAAGFEDAQDFEYVELTNIGNEPLPLLDVAFCAGIEYTFPATTLLPGEYLVLVKNQAAFEQRYGVGTADIAGEVRRAGKVLERHRMFPRRQRVLRLARQRRREDHARRRHVVRDP